MASIKLNAVKPRRVYLFLNEKKRESSTPLRRSLVLEKFDREKAIAYLDDGQAIIPIWLDKLHNLSLKK